MGIFGGDRSRSDKPAIGRIGNVGPTFVAVDSDGMAVGGSHADPVDNLIELAGKLADKDEASGR